MPSKIGSELVFNGASSIAAELPNGNFVVAYQKGSNAYVQVVSESGVLVGNPNPLGNSIINVTVTVLQNGNFVVIYQTLSGVSYAQVIGSNGALMGSPNQAATFVTTLSNGNFLVAYGSAATPYLQVIDTNGNLVGTPIQGVYQTLLVGGNFVVVYPSGSNYYAQVIMPNGSLVGSSIQVILGSWQTVTPLSNGNFVVPYMTGSNYYAQLVSNNGTLIGSPMSCGIGLKAIIVLSNGNFVLGYVTTSSGSTGYGSTGYADIFKTTGTQVAHSLFSSSAPTTLVSLQKNGTFLVIFPASIANVFAMQIVNAAGTSIGNPISIANSSPNMTVLPNGNFVTTVLYITTTQTYALALVVDTGSTINLSAGSATPPIYTVTPLPNSNFMLILQNSASSYSAQFYTGGGTAVGSAIQATTNPTTTVLPNGGCVLAYTNGSSSYLQIFNATGALVGSAIPAGNNVNNVTVLENGNFFAVTYQNGLTYYAQMINVNGGLVGSPIQATANPSVTLLPDGNTLVVYPTSITNYNGQLFDSNALPVTSAFQLGSMSENSALALGDDYFILKWQTPDTNTHVQVFYAGTNLTVVNANQNVDYSQDASEVDFNEIAVLTEYNEANATLTLSDPQAGTLTTATSGNITATFSSQTGVWEVSGDVNDVNAILNATQFIPAPNYVSNFSINLVVNDAGNRTEDGLLAWIGTPTAPRLVNNTFNIMVGETVTVDSSDIGVLPETRPVTITVSQMQGGYFQLASNPGQPILQFTRQQLDAKQVQIVSDESAPVSYAVSVSNIDGSFASSPTLASVIFTDNPPMLLGTVPTEFVAINEPFHFEVSANQIFKNTNSNASSLTFSAKLTSNASLPPWMSFNATQPDQLAFSGNPTQFGSTAVDLCASAPLNKTTCTDFNVVVVPANTTSSNTNTNTTINNSVNSIIIPVASSAGTAALVAGGFVTGLSIWRCAKNTKSRENYPLANYVQGNLKLQGVDNFDSRKGRDYVAAIKNITDSLKLNHGIDTTMMRMTELQNLANDIAASARNKISSQGTFFGGSIITVAQLSNKAQDIAGEVAGKRGTNQTLQQVEVLSSDSVEMGVL